jgi:hypothetical protein
MAAVVAMAMAVAAVVVATTAVAMVVVVMYVCLAQARNPVPRDNGATQNPVHQAPDSANLS